jgi:hypothetical protein
MAGHTGASVDCGKREVRAGDWWLMPGILAAWEVEIRRARVQGQPRQKAFKTLFQPIAGHSGVCLSSQLHGRLGSGGPQFQVSLGEKVCREVFTPISWVENRKCFSPSPPETLYCHTEINPCFF